MNALAGVNYTNAQEAVAAASAAATSASSAVSQAGIAAAQAGIATTKASEAAASAGAANTSAGEASSSASAAAASAASAAALAGAFVGTSASSISIGAGTKNFTTQAGELYTPGVFMTAVSAANNANWVFGQVLSYVGTALSLNVTMTGGSGTFADWNLSLAGPQGATGPQGPQGPTGGLAGGNATGAINELKAANITAAATTDVWSIAGNSATLVGTTAITSVGTAPQVGAKRTLIAAAITQLINSANLILPGGTNYTTAVGDRLEIYAETTTQHRVSIFKANGNPVKSTSAAAYTSRTANTQLVNADRGLFIDITSGTFTQTFDTLANLDGDWNVWIRNSGTGEITIPSSDGVTNWKMYACETRLFMKDQVGTALRSVVIVPFYLAVISSMTFTKPPGYRLFEGMAWGAGASGASSFSGSFVASGGGGGAWEQFSLPASMFGATESIVIGAGGSAVSSGGSSFTDGNNGGSTSIGTVLSVAGGVKGTGASSGGSAPGGAGGVAGYGNSGGQGGNASTGSSGAGAPSYYGGGGGGGSPWGATAGAGGASKFGGSGGAAVVGGNGNSGTAPGGAGAGAQNNFVSGAGARGELRIWGGL
ncbi:hypothetical protein ASC94_09245 [Massilia sp. Root418]|nr:hypothetical protein ASC94_09245 [Massilia sp. Root418]